MSGISKPKQHYNLHTNNSISSLPRNPLVALKKTDWKRAMTDEFRALIDNNTWDLVPRTHHMNIVRIIGIFRHKTKYDGSLERYKAHLMCDAGLKRRHRLWRNLQHRGQTGNNMYGPIHSSF